MLDAKAACWVIDKWFISCSVSLPVIVSLSHRKGTCVLILIEKLIPSCIYFLPGTARQSSARSTWSTFNKCDQTNQPSKNVLHMSLNGVQIWIQNNCGLQRSSRSSGPANGHHMSPPTVFVAVPSAWRLCLDTKLSKWNGKDTRGAIAGRILSVSSERMETVSLRHSGLDPICVTCWIKKQLLMLNTISRYSYTPGWHSERFLRHARIILLTPYKF